VRVFRLEGCCSWVQHGNTLFGDGDGDQLGAGQISLSSDGTWLAAGGNNSGNEQGKTSLYNLLKGTWEKIGEIVGNAADDELGFSINVSGDGSHVAVPPPRIGQGTPGYARVRQGTPGYARVRQGTPGYAIIYRVE
jgi:hypothetical protein